MNALETFIAFRYFQVFLSMTLQELALCHSIIHWWGQYEKIDEFSWALYFQQGSGGQLYVELPPSTQA